MKTYKELSTIVIEEHQKVYEAVDEFQVEQYLNLLSEAKCIQVFGMGRMKCSVRGFTMRLMHMGLNAHVVYDTTCPEIKDGDLLVIHGACTSVGYLVAQMAKKRGAKVVSITADPNNRISQLSDLVVELKGQIHGGREYEIPSIQPMAALFEQSVFIFSDIIIQLLMQKMNISIESMKSRHTNLDGYMDFNSEE